MWQENAQHSSLPTRATLKWTGTARFTVGAGAGTLPAVAPKAAQAFLAMQQITLHSARLNARSVDPQRGRSSDILKSNGQTLFSTELEGAMLIEMFARP